MQTFLGVSFNRIGYPYCNDARLELGSIEILMREPSLKYLHVKNKINIEIPQMG